MKKALTDAYVRTAVAPATGRSEVADLRCVGLSLRVTAAGAKTWSFRFRDPRSAKVTRATIGNYPDISLEAARDRAAELRREVAAGVNPIERKREDKARASSRTFEALATRYMTEHARRHKRTADADDRALRLHVLPRWQKRAFDTIQRADVIELCEEIVTAGKPTQANRVQALISKVFSFAVDASLIEANPCSRLKKRSKEVRGTRVLSDAEIRLFWREVSEPPNSSRIGQALRLVLLTGVRVTELAGAELKEFEHLDNFEKASWTIPAIRSKNGKTHLVPLSGPAVAIVGDLINQAEGREKDGRPRFLLDSPSRSRGPIDGHALSVGMTRLANKFVSSRGKSAEKLRSEDCAAIATWAAERPSAHDLRRTLATRLAGLGVPAEDISACLNHARRGVTALHYDHYDRAREKRHALTLWAQKVSEIVENSPAATNVVTLRPAS